MIEYARKRIDMINRGGELAASTRNDLSTLSEGEIALMKIITDCGKFLAN